MGIGLRGLVSFEFGDEEYEVIRSDLRECEVEVFVY